MKRSFILLIPLILLILGTLLVILSYLTLQTYQNNLHQQISNLQLELLKNTRRITPIHLPMLLYHYVENVTDERDTIRKSLNINPFIFESQIKTLLSNNYHIITFDNVIKYFAGQEELPINPIIITFDDGYRDFYTDVFPILQKYHIPAVLYVVSGFVDSTHNYITSQQLKILAKSPLVEIGSHSVKHYSLTMLDEKELRLELVQSKTDLELLINKPVNHFAYPNGEYNALVIKYTKEAGYETAVTTDKGNIQSYQQIFQLTRIRPGSTTGEYFLSLLK